MAYELGGECPTHCLQRPRPIPRATRGAELTLDLPVAQNRQVRRVADPKP